MNSQQAFGGVGRLVPISLLSAFSCALLLLPSPAIAGGVVTNCTEAALRAAMVGGGTVTFACDGTITLAQTITNLIDTWLDGSGHAVTITGPQAFYVSSGSTLTLVSLTIANCHAPNGAGVFNNGGTVNLKNVVLQNNQTGPIYGYPITGVFGGGAIYNWAGGRLSATNCAFNWNSAAVPVNSQHPAAGGAIYDSGGTISLQRCVFYGNATAGSGNDPMPDPGNQSYGGAIYCAGSLSADSCSFSNNSAQGGQGGHYSQGPSGWPGGPGGNAGGGAIYSQGTLTISRSLFGSNSASGGFGGEGSVGPTASTGGRGGNGGSGGGASGGGVYGASGVIMNCTFQGSLATAGRGGSGGYGGTSNDPYQTGGPGGNGGNGANASGGAIAGGLNLVNCTIAFNSAVASFGGSGGSGGYGLKGMGTSGTDGTNGSAVAGGMNAGAMTNSLLVANSPAGSWSGSHNVEMTGPDPNLGPLTNNGGPTLTMALLPGSLAIDTGDTSAAPFTDQRGFPRPAGLAPDIGAFEFGSMLPSLSITRPSANALNVIIQGNSNQWCRLLISSNLADWIPVASNQIGPAGTVAFQDSSSASCRFYRVVMP